MKAEIKAKIREALAARTPGTWSVGRGGEVVVPIGDPAIDPKMLEAEAEERRDALAKWQAAWDAASDEDRAARTAAGWTRDDARHKTESDDYGGALICESIRPNNAAFIAAAPAWLAELLDLDDRAEAVVMAGRLAPDPSCNACGGAGGFDFPRSSVNGGVTRLPCPMCLLRERDALAREVAVLRDREEAWREMVDRERGQRVSAKYEADHALAELAGYRKLIGAIGDALGEDATPGRPSASEVARVVAELAATRAPPATTQAPACATCGGTKRELLGDGSAGFRPCPRC